MMFVASRSAAAGALILTVACLCVLVGMAHARQSSGRLELAAAAESPQAEDDFEAFVFQLTDPSGRVQTGLKVGMGIIGALVLIGLLGEARGPRLDPALPGALVVGARKYTIHSLSGIVRAPTRAMEAVLSVSGGYDRPVTSRTNLHEQFFLHEPGGKETAIQLVNTNIPVRDGHIVSAVWAVRKGKSGGPYILFRNHSTDRAHPLHSAMRGLFTPRKRILLGLLVLAWIFSLSKLLQALPTIDEVPLSPFMLWSGPLLSLAALVLFLVYRGVLTTLRLHKFRRDLRALYPLMDENANRSAAAVRVPETPTPTAEPTAT